MEDLCGFLSALSQRGSVLLTSTIPNFFGDGVAKLVYKAALGTPIFSAPGHPSPRPPCFASIPDYQVCPVIPDVAVWGGDMYSPSGEESSAMIAPG